MLLLQNNGSSSEESVDTMNVCMAQSSELSNPILSLNTALYSASQGWFTPGDIDNNAK
jgi:hypothetical protein